MLISCASAAVLCLCLSGRATGCLCFSGLTVDSWLENAADLLAFATREVDIARTLQSSLEAMLKQAECDVRNQVERTNRALDTRVQQTRTAKQTLEDKLSMVSGLADKRSMVSGLADKRSMVSGLADKRPMVSGLSERDTELAPYACCCR